MEDSKPLKSYEKEPESQTASEMIDDIGFGCYQFRLILVIGLLASIEAMEILLLAVLGPSLQCYWNLSPTSTTILTMTTLGGIGLGGFIFGILSDRFGRRTIIRFALCVVVYFSLLTTLSPSMTWVIVLRALSGSGIGGVMAVSYILYTELSPSAARARGIVVIVAFWAVGTCIACLIAWISMERYGWRITVAFCAIPGFVSIIIAFTVLPESPLYLVLKNNTTEALQMINSIAKANNKPSIKSRLILPPVTNSALFYQSFQLMYGSNYRQITITLQVIWFLQGFCYFGNVILGAMLPHKIEMQCGTEGNLSSTKNVSDVSCCIQLGLSSYQALAVSALGELGSFPIAVVLSDTLGRRWAVRISGVLSALFALLIGILCPLSPIILDLLLLLNRLCILSLLYAVLVYTSEIFPTSARTTSLGSCQAAARLGSLMTPLVSQLLLPHMSVLATLSVYSIMALAAAMAGFFLNVETKGRPLSESMGPTEESVVYNTFIQHIKSK